VTTTALLIEILLSGTLASVWVLLGTRLLFPDALAVAFGALSRSNSLGNLIAAVGLLAIYLLGWVAHFIGEMLLDRFYQSRYRDELFAKAGVPFFTVRTVVFQCGSEASIDDIQLDRQILRITRAAATNLMVIALLILPQPAIDLWRKVALSSAALGLAGFALAYWQIRYQSTFRKFLDVYNVIQQTSAAPGSRQNHSEATVSITPQKVAQNDRQSFVAAIEKAITAGSDISLAPFRFTTDRRNELLFFLKPELFAGRSPDDLHELLNLILGRIEEAGLRIDGAHALSGSWLRTYGVMDRHYGYINQLSRGASKMLSDADKAEILRRLEWNAPHSGVPFVGGHEFLEGHPSYDAQSVNQLWETKKSIKLRGGLYVQGFEVDGKPFVMVDGFHPQQLSHYTADQQRIVVALCHSDTDWATLRDRLIGDTFPERAIPESIRGILWSERHSLELREISVAYNYVHLSAGPFEGLHEIRNFLGSGLVEGFRLEDTVVGRAMTAAGYSRAVIERVLSNPMTSRARDLFSVTENMNTDDAVRFLQQEPEITAQRV
jgi:hypothetical protein